MTTKETHMFKKAALTALAEKLVKALDPIIDPLFKPIRSLAARIRNRFGRRKAPVPVRLPFTPLPLETKLYVPNSAFA